VKKLVTGLAVFGTSSLISLTGVLATDYPPSGDSAGVAGDSLPSTGSTLLSGPLMYANVLLFVGLAIAGSVTIRRRSLNS
jgi:hypothetical protein